MPVAAIIRREDAAPARSFAARASLAVTSAAALAVGLSVSPLGFFSAPMSISGAGLDPTDPWRLAIPALLIATAITAAAASALTSSALTAWAVTAFGATCTAATTLGARWWFGDTRWTSLLTLHVWMHWVAVVAATAMGIAAGGLIAVMRRTTWPVPLAAAFAVGLVARTGGIWFQTRYDLAAAGLAAAALGTVALSTRARRHHRPDPPDADPPDTGATGSRYRRADTPDVDASDRVGHDPRAGASGVRGRVLLWVLPAGVLVGLGAVEYAYRVELSAVYSWSDANISTPLFVTAGRVYAVLAAICALLVVYLARYATRVGLTARSVLVATALAIALGVGGGGDGWLPSRRTIAVAVIATALAWVAPVTWRRIPVLACVELAGVVGLAGGLVRVLSQPGVSAASYAIAIGSLLTVVAELRRSRGAGAAPVVGLAFLVFSVTPVAELLAGGLLWRAAPRAEVPVAFDRLVWVVLVGAMVPALVAVGRAASRVSDSAD